LENGGLAKTVQLLPIDSRAWTFCEEPSIPGLGLSYHWQSSVNALTRIHHEKCVRSAETTTAAGSGNNRGGSDKKRQVRES